MPPDIARQFAALRKRIGELERRSTSGRWTTGDLKCSALATPEPGWLAVDGSAITSAHPALRAKLLADGARWGTDANGNPYLPNLQDAFPLGAGAAHPLGTSGGEEAVTLTIAEMPSHSHGYLMVNSGAGQANYNYAPTGSANNTGISSQRGPMDPTGGGASHNNMPPFVAVSWFVKA